MTENLNLPAEIDTIHRQLDEARDLETVREIKDRAEALRVYCQKHEGLLEAHNRLAGVIARCERRIGQELRQAEQTGQRQRVGRPAKSSETPRISDLGLTYDQAAAYQDMASVEENVILDAIDRAGKEGREVTKKDIRKAVKEALGKPPKAPPAPPPPLVEPELEDDLRAAAEEAARLPTPSQARKLAAETGKIVAASDGRLYTDKPVEQERAEAAHRDRIFAYLNPIRAIAEAGQEPEDWLAELPTYMHRKVDRHLDRALDRLLRLKAGWRPQLVRRKAG
jgi:hypothetical protein